MDRDRTALRTNLPPGLIAFDYAPRVILYAERARELFLLNYTASFVWRALGDGHSLAEVCHWLMETTQVETAEAERDVLRLLEEWERLAGLPEPEEAAECDSYDFASHDDDPRARQFHYKRLYRLLDLCFTFRTNDPAVAEVARQLMRHLEVSEEESTAVIDVVRSGKRWFLSVGDAVVDSCSSSAAIAPMLHANILMAAYLRTDCLAAIHAGAVLHDDGCILMPATSGSGKSTLTAGLVARGLGYCTDDLAVLVGPPPIRVRPVPVAIGLKRGSWAVLADKLPALQLAPTHLRSDGKSIRYLTVPGAGLSTHAYLARALVFPRYEQGALTEWRAIDVADALFELTRAGYDARLSVELIGVLLDWLKTLPRYRLTYSDLDEGVAGVQEILAR